MNRGFFHTSKWRKFSFYAAGATTCGLFLGNYVPHTFGLPYLLHFVQCYENGVERAVPSIVQTRLEKALDMLHTELHRKSLRSFTVFGFDLYYAGSTKYRFGGALGIPVNYGYTSPDDINYSEIRFRNKKIEWNSPSSKLLQQSLVLDETEQIFGFCKTVLQLKTNYVLLNSIFPSLSFLMVYSVGHYLNLRLNLFARHISVRMVMYTILALFGIGSCTFMKDYNQVSTDVEIDKYLATLGTDLVAAGMRYYDKQLNKNIALRQLSGDDSYTALGNENYVLRQKSMPLTARKLFFEQKWHDLQKELASSIKTDLITEG
ncbi:transmembrane protein 177 [Scaptodrosophila lebanonensis]|uniref:Transmembrane protein 177 n=1 Tax=Drosophila lebanonensis TaxID=7225 RepID=A0A6J2TJA2_DROLE|nr:transmembrane protein 177 [Scaptodrosophila lebanonensis]